MFHVNDYAHNVSLRLSEVMDDIGVNEQMVMKRRRVYMLKETMGTITDRLMGYNVTVYNPGSQTEGTTTPGLNSDLDILYCKTDFNVMQDWAEWKQGKINLLMIQDENTTPGYCFLQAVRHDVPLPETDIPHEHFIRDTRGRVLLKNSMVKDFIREGNERHGPSHAIQGQDGFCDIDFVIAFQCTSWPQSAAGWLERQGIGRWPTPGMKRYAVRNGCCVVAVGSKVSMNPEIEWRISTTLAERCLMFNLNITQIRCYVIMKMILKTYLNCRGESCLSSFMCKTTLLHCIEKTEPTLWQEHNLFICLTYCLLQLNNFLMNEECPHFIIKENNLMAGQFSAEVKSELLERISCLIQRDGLGLLGIPIDNLGERLQIKLNMIPQLVHYLPSPVEISETVSGLLYYYFARTVSAFNKLIINNHKETILLCVYGMMNYSKEGNILEQTACRFLLPHLCTTLGSVLASVNIGIINTVSPEALVWFSAGLNSDALASRLKLASAFYCAGDIERAEFILRFIKRQYDNGGVVHVCFCCQATTPPTVVAEFCRICNEQNEEVIQQNVAFCVRFLQCEINCVPRELQYEMFRSTQDDLIVRGETYFWMDWAVVDSLPFLYFLQYKTYGHLQRYQDQQQALRNLVWTIEVQPNLGHRETAMNLLGQCMEQENRPQNALQYYMLSLQQRARNNAARLHICMVLARLANMN